MTFGKFIAWAETKIIKAEPSPYSYSLLYFTKIEQATHVQRQNHRISSAFCVQGTVHRADILLTF